MAGNAAPLPVKGSVSDAEPGMIEVVVVGMVLPCEPTVTVAGRVVDVAITLVGNVSIDVVGELDVVVAAAVVVVWIAVGAAVVVVGANVVVVGAIVVVVVGAVVVVGQ